MEEIIIYKFQLEAIKEVLRLAVISEPDKTCFGRMALQAKKFAENALEGRKDERVKYIS